MSIKKVLINSAAINAVSAFYVALLNFLIIPVLISKLGLQQFGLIGIINVFAIMGYISLFEFGIASSLPRYIAEFKAQNNYSKIIELINSSFLLFFIIGLIVFLVLLPFLNIITNNWFDIPHEYSSAFKSVLIVITLSYSIQFPLMIADATLQGFQRFDILKIALMFAETVKIGTIYFLINKGYGFQFVIYSNIGSSFILLLIYLIFIVKIIPNFSFTKISFKHFKEIKRLSVLLFFGRLSSVIANNSDRLLISFFLGPVSMGIYSVLFKLPQIFNKFLGLANIAVTPVASELFAKKDMYRLKELFHRGFRLYFSFIAPIILAFIFFSKDFLFLWVGKEFIHLDRLLQLLLVWSLMTPLLFGGNILLGMNRGMRQITVFRWLQSILKVVALFFLIKLLGIKGVVYGYLISYLVLFFYLMVFKRFIGISLKLFFKDIISIILTGTIPLLFFMFIIGYYPPDDFIKFFLYIIIWVILQWSLILWVTFDVKDRQSILEILLNIKLIYQNR